MIDTFFQSQWHILRNPCYLTEQKKATFIVNSFSIGTIFTKDIFFQFCWTAFICLTNDSKLKEMKKENIRWIGLLFRPWWTNIQKYVCPYWSLFNNILFHSNALNSNVHSSNELLLGVSSTFQLDYGKFIEFNINHKSTQFSCVFLKGEPFYFQPYKKS